MSYVYSSKSLIKDFPSLIGYSLLLIPDCVHTKDSKGRRETDFEVE